MLRRDVAIEKEPVTAGDAPLEEHRQRFVKPQRKREAVKKIMGELVRQGLLFRTRSIIKRIGYMHVAAVVDESSARLGPGAVRIEVGDIAIVVGAIGEAQDSMFAVALRQLDL